MLFDSQRSDARCLIKSVTQLARGIGTRLREDRIKRFSRQMGWTLSSRIVAAFLQMAVLVLLARGLTPAYFAFVSSINVALLGLCGLNGFGIMRQISYRRSRNPQDAQLGSLFARRLRYTYASAVLWVLVTVALGIAFDDPRWFAVAPACIWLMAEQNTQIWNTIAVADGRASQLMSSFLLRRLPVIAFLLVALHQGWDIVWAWSIGLAVGAVMAYAHGYRAQEPWARIMLPWRRLITEKTSLDLGYWWSQVGDDIRDLDVPLLALIDPVVAGIYAFPARFVRPMNLITLATGSVAFPVLSRRNTVPRRQVLALATVGSAPAALMAVVLFFASPLLPVIAGSAYKDSVPTMQIICLATVLWAPSTLLVIFLQSRSGSATRVAGATVMTFNCLQVIGIVLGGAVAGATGAAALYAVGQGLCLLCLALFAMRYASPEPSHAAEALVPASQEAHQ